jgi:hypothetical protein
MVRGRISAGLSFLGIELEEQRNASVKRMSSPRLNPVVYSRTTARRYTCGRSVDQGAGDNIVQVLNSCMMPLSEKTYGRIAWCRAVNR